MKLTITIIRIEVIKISVIQSLNQFFSPSRGFPISEQANYKIGHGLQIPTGASVSLVPVAKADTSETLAPAK